MIITLITLTTPPPSLPVTQDLATIQRNVHVGAYATPQLFANDVLLTFSNCLAYHSQNKELRSLARELTAEFKSLYDLAIPVALRTLPANGVLAGGVRGIGEDEDSESEGSEDEELVEPEIVEEGFGVKAAERVLVRNRSTITYNNH